MSEWISIEDALPDNDVVVIAYYGNLETLGNKVYTALHISEGYFVDADDEGYASSELVTHWMPCPEPPVEKGVAH